MSEDSFVEFEPLLASAGDDSPWKEGEYYADMGLLEDLIGIPLGQGATSQSGWLAKALDSWIAHELRRSGFHADEVWPRQEAPRVLPHEVSTFINRLPKAMRADLHKRLLKDKKTAPTSAKVLGRAYVKQVDVVVAQWARGPEIMVSTKTMESSFGNNMFNRFEESYGDAKNLRGRHPLAAIGFVFLLNSSIHSQAPGSYERAIDMMRKLKAELDVYDATALIIADWTPRSAEGIKVRPELVPEDVSINRFFEEMVAAVLSRTPIEMHVAVRERREAREIPVPEQDPEE
ncbi:hypothetical protein AB0G20_16400 [Streptomyces sp. NPDC024017]|uniref:hypothetical protein n=1 Tax=Streptomyces sp. NPDC024017 TaxID=3154326 RepID=UPI0033FDD710